MSINTAGFLAAPTLMVGCLAVAFGLYGFWGAQKCDLKKIRVHFYWLLVSCVLLGAISTARVYTAHTFCEKHNCVVDHMFYPKGSHPTIIPAEKTANLFVVKEHSPAKQAAADKGSTPADSGSSDSSSSQPKAIPIYREPCYVDDGRPSVDICTKAHNLSAITTVAATVPLNLIFAVIIRSLYLKVKRGELPEAVEIRPVGRPIQVGHQIPPMAIYEAASLDGTPASGRYDKPEEIHDAPGEGASAGNPEDGNDPSSSSRQI
jgi:hypothetical protein